MVKMAMKYYNESLQSMRHGFGLLNPNKRAKAVNAYKKTPQDL